MLFCTLVFVTGAPENSNWGGYFFLTFCFLMSFHERSFAGSVRIRSSNQGNFFLAQFDFLNPISIFSRSSNTSRF
jgi:hypothetical protein